MCVVIKWRVQTNTINGHLVTFGRAKTAFVCPVRAAVRIQDRAECLQHPLVYLGFLVLGILFSTMPTNIWVYGLPGCMDTLRKGMQRVYDLYISGSLT